eukprot:519652-Rhodomonas_salina.2
MKASSEAVRPPSCQKPFVNIFKHFAVEEWRISHRLEPSLCRSLVFMRAIVQLSTAQNGMRGSSPSARCETNVLISAVQQKERRWQIEGWCGAERGR